MPWHQIFIVMRHHLDTGNRATSPVPALWLYKYGAGFGRRRSSSHSQGDVAPDLPLAVSRRLNLEQTTCPSLSFLLCKAHETAVHTGWSRHED